MSVSSYKNLLDKSKLWIFPAVFYSVLFCILTYPIIFDFSTHFFTSIHDGLQNVWNIWWVNKAITDLHQSPYFTTYLHYPKGTSLLGHTLNPFNGIIGIFLLKFLTLIETHNFIIIFSFVIGGVTAFWLSYYITKSYWSSLAAGYIFTFSQFHFREADAGHLQIVSLEWIPLFVLCFIQLVYRPNIKKAVLAGIVLYLVILCDYYYFFYCVLTGVIVIVWYSCSSEDKFYFIRKQYLISFAAFIVTCLLTSGILVISLLKLNISDPLVGSHNANEFSLDLIAPFIPGGQWRFGNLTEFFWSKVLGFTGENNVYIGLSIVILIIYSWKNREKFLSEFKSLYLWYGILLFFGIMALGPVLQIGGKQITPSIMPYALFQIIFPPLKLSGCPVRMIVMVTLAGSIISAIALSQIFKTLNPKKMYVGSAMVATLLFIDFLPRTLPCELLIIPETVNVLKMLPTTGSVMDTYSEPMAISLYYQTIHEKPLLGGYIARYPTSVYNENKKKQRPVAINNDYFITYDVGYLLTKGVLNGAEPLLIDSFGIKLYNIKDLLQFRN